MGGPPKLYIVIIYEIIQLLLNGGSTPGVAVVFVNIFGVAVGTGGLHNGDDSGSVHGSFSKLGVPF